MRWIASAAVLSLTGCANLNTVGRTTVLPFDGTSNGVAIHLDAKQRLVLAKEFGAVCAEPSPDALSAYALSLGGSVARPSKNAVSLAATLSESAGSIGLRTQSIQLMRDALYRVCEMYYSRALNDVMVMQLHQRYQDVMVAVMAIEQLTGATVAQQVALTQSGGSTAISTVADLQRLLDDARTVEEAKKAARDTKDAAAKKVEEALKTARAERDGAPDATARAAAQIKVDTLERDLTAAQEALVIAESIYKEAVAYRETVEEARKAAYASATAQTTGSGQFSTAGRTISLNDQSAAHISDAVENIVKAVVNKDHLIDSCFGLLANYDDVLEAREDATEAAQKAASDEALARTARETADANRTREQRALIASADESKTRAAYLANDAQAQDTLVTSCRGVISKYAETAASLSPQTPPPAQGGVTPTPPAPGATR